MKLIGEAVVIKARKSEKGDNTYLDLIDFSSGSTFQLGTSQPVNGVKSETKVRIDGDVTFGRGAYGMYMKLSSGTITPVKAG